MTLPWMIGGTGGLYNYAPSYYISRWTQDWYSNGFPVPSLPDLGAYTDVQVRGWFDGSSGCTFTHSYYGAVYFYANVHWETYCN